MTFEQRDGTGTLFRNDKGSNRARPDYRGAILINGEMYELAAWIKKGRKGDFLSLAAKVSSDDARQDRGRVQDMPEGAPCG